MSQCEVCSATVTELRRGRCWGCYTRWVQARPVGHGAQCAICDERRIRLLCRVELLGAWRALCFGCSGQVARLSPLPTTMVEIKQTLARERRDGDRRAGADDRRVLQFDRRIDDRRTPDRSRPAGHAAPTFDLEDLEVEIIIDSGPVRFDIEAHEQTRIHRVPEM